MTVKEKWNKIQQAISFLKTAPNGKKRRRKPFLKALHIANKKVFFEIFIPKVLMGNVNNQYRRLKDLPNILPLLLKTKNAK